MKRFCDVSEQKDGAKSPRPSLRRAAEHRFEIKLRPKKMARKKIAPPFYFLDFSTDLKDRM